MRWPTVNASRHAKLSSLKAHPQKLPGKLPVPPSRRRVHSTSGVTEILSGPPSGRPRLSHRPRRRSMEGCTPPDNR